MADTPSKSTEPLTIGEVFERFGAWGQREPLQMVLMMAILGVLIYFFGFYRVFMNGAESTATWAKHAWNSENDLEHGILIVPIAIGIAFWHAGDLATVQKKPAWSGLGFVLIGVILFVLSVRTLQPRVALLAAPFFGYGITRYFWGREAARIILFPCVFLLFAVPAGFLVSRTVALQTMAANIAAGLSNMIGIGVIADGATISAKNGAFHFEVAGGCSGIRSLTAMMMLAALYVHFTQKELWKKGVIFASSLGFAWIGNLVRLFSVVLFARFINADIAGNQYHDYSGFVFFPIAVAAMVAFSNLLNRNWGGMLREALKPEEGTVLAPMKPSPTTASVPKAKEAGSAPGSYDY